MRIGVCLSICLVHAACLAADPAGRQPATQPGAKGTLPIAAWDGVPYQRITKPFKVGVVAFHEKPLDVVFMVVQPPLAPERKNRLEGALGKGEANTVAEHALKLTGSIHMAEIGTPLSRQEAALFRAVLSRVFEDDPNFGASTHPGETDASRRAPHPDAEASGTMMRGTARITLKIKPNKDAEQVGFELIAKQLHIVSSPSLNTRTGVWEFFTVVDPSMLDDGPFEVYALPYVAGNERKPEDDHVAGSGWKGLERAIGEAIGEALVSGLVRLLMSDLKPLTLYANAKGTLSAGDPVWVDAKSGDDGAAGTKDAPLKTLAAGVKKAPDGGTVYLMPGDYSAQALGGGFKRDYWTIITPAPGVKRDDVQIGKGRTGTDKLCFRNVTLYADPPKRGYNTILDGANGRTSVWCDNCKFYNRKGRWGGGGNHFGNRYKAYVTGGITTEMDNGPGAILLRNHKIVKITSDALTNAGTAINCEVRDIDPGKTGAHPDWHQSYTGGKGKYKTCIIYNCSGFDCQAQGFFGHYLKDSAFVNCIFEKVPGHALSQYSGHMDHVLWLHCTVPNQHWLWRGTLRGTNCHVLNGVFAGMHEAQGGDAGGFVIDRNHFIEPKRAMGTNATTGDARFVDPNANDYRLRADSPAARTGAHLQCVPADINGKPYDKDARNRGCYAGTHAAPTTSPRPDGKE